MSTLTGVKAIDVDCACRGDSKDPDCIKKSIVGGFYELRALDEGWTRL
jgi:hypothetical protein